MEYKIVFNKKNWAPSFPLKIVREKSQLPEGAVRQGALAQIYRIRNGERTKIGNIPIENFTAETIQNE